MRLNQVEPIRQATFGGRLALARHSVALPSNEEPLTLGVLLVKHHPVKCTNKVSLGLKKDQTPSETGATVKSDGVAVFHIIHGSLLS